MVRKNEVLTREENRICFAAARRTATQEACPSITEREIPVDTIEQTWILDVGEPTRGARPTPNLVNTLVRVMKWLNHLGGGEIDESRLGSRHNIHHNFRTNGIRL